MMGKSGPTDFTVLAEELDVLAQPPVTLFRAERQRHLGAPEAHVPGGRRLRAGAVEVEALLGGAADEPVDGLAAQLSQQVPEGQVDDGDDGDGEALAAVEHGRAVHLLKSRFVLRGLAPMRKRSKCWWMSQQAGGPPNPVAKPTVPSDASTSTRNEPRTLMPQLVRDLRYCSHLEQGVDMSVSMSLGRVSDDAHTARGEAGRRTNGRLRRCDSRRLRWC